MVGLQDLFAQAWIVQQADRRNRNRNSFFHRGGVRDLITWTDGDIRFLIQKPACGNVDAIDAVFSSHFPIVFQSSMLFCFSESSYAVRDNLIHEEPLKEPRICSMISFANR